MNKTTITILATIGALILAIAIYFVVKTNIQAQVIRLDNAVTASVERQTATHDALWKTIKGGRVMSKEADSLAYETIRAWSERGQVMAFESTPQTASFNSLRMQLLNTLQDQNDKLTSIRSEVVYATKCYNDYVMNPWRGFFLTAEQQKPKKAQIITSDLSQNAVQTGKDNMEWFK